MEELNETQQMILAMTDEEQADYWADIALSDPERTSTVYQVTDEDEIQF